MKSTQTESKTAKHNPCSQLDSKRRGEVAEAAFLHKVATLGFSVAKPWGESDRYDFILDNGFRSWRVQVKSAYTGTHGYTFRAAGRVPNKVYTAKDIDFIVAYIAPEELWYVIPIAMFTKRSTIKIYPWPKRKPSPFERYREAWCLLACPFEGKCRKAVVVASCSERTAGAVPCLRETGIEVSGGTVR